MSDVIGANGRPLVALVVFPGFTLTDMSGPADVLNSSGQYDVEVVAKEAGPVRAGSWDPGITVTATRSLADLGGVDTLIVAGGWSAVEVARDQEVVEQVARLAAGSRRVASVCTGAFVLAATGLLAGRRATTHWQFCETLAEAHPDITVEDDPIFVQDGRFWTSAGVTAGIDLSLALVEADFGRELSLSIARAMVVFMQRPGGQSQFSAQLMMQSAARQPIRDLQHWVLANLDADLSIERLAAQAGMSARHFSRVFRRETGTAPGEYVESVRVAAARQMLETTDLSLRAVARKAGFGTVETFHRSMKRALGVTPAEYRARFTSVLADGSVSPPRRIEHEAVLSPDAAKRVAT